MNSEKKELKCEERIDNALNLLMSEATLPNDYDNLEAWKVKAKDLGLNLESNDVQDYIDAVDRYFDETPLAYSKTINIRVDLSYGGPQDYFVVEYDPTSNEFIGGTYHFLDWFDGATRALTQDQVSKLVQAYHLSSLIQEN